MSGDWARDYDIVPGGPTASSNEPTTIDEFPVVPAGPAQGATVIHVGPKDLSPDSWLHEERFAEFVAAYQFATSHFSRAAVAFSKVTPEDAYWIHKTITTALERNRRVADERREEGR